LLLVAGCKHAPAAKPVASQPQQAQTTTNQTMVQRTLLYPSEEDMLLTEFQVMLPDLGSDQQNMQALVQRYLGGPAGDGQVLPFPDNCTVRSLFILGGNEVVVDLGGPVKTGGGSATELARVYGIIDTLHRNFPQVTAVKILVDGQETDTLLGHVDLSHSLPPEPGMLESYAPPSSPDQPPAPSVSPSGATSDAHP
jgi:hypothetical protein